MMEKVFKYGFIFILISGTIIAGVIGYLYYDYSRPYREAELPYEKELDEHGIKVGELERVLSSKDWQTEYKKLDNKHQKIFKKITIERLRQSQELIMDFNTQYEANEWDKRNRDTIACSYILFNEKQTKILSNLYKHTEVEHLRALKSSRWFAFKITKNSKITKEECYERFGSDD